MGRRRSLGLAAALVCVVLGTAPAAAEEPTALGWWWVGRPSAALPGVVSPIPAVPEGGLYVAGDATGPQGISALRFELGPDASATSLTLTIAETSGTPSIEVCAPTEEWAPAEDGGWDERPEADCEAASVSGTVNDDQTEVTFALADLQDAEGVLDVVLVPSADAEAFRVAFEAPGPEALTVTDPDAEILPAPPGSSASPAPRRPTSPSFETPSAPSPQIEPTPGSDAPASSVTTGGRPTLIGSGVSASDAFAYPLILMLPLVLLVGGSFLSWTLTRPVTVGALRAR